MTTSLISSDKSSSILEPVDLYTLSAATQILKWSFPAVSLNNISLPKLTLIGASRAASETAFYIPELKFLFDSGLKVHNTIPAHIFITHTHSDHCSLITKYLSRHSPPTLVLPEKARVLMEQYLKTEQALSWCGRIIEDNERCIYLGVNDGDKINIRANGITSKQVQSEKGKNDGDFKEGYEVHVLGLDHSIPCVGYLIHSKRKRLNPKYANLTGKEISDLKKNHHIIDEEYLFPLFAYCLDTTASIFEVDFPSDQEVDKSIIDERSSKNTNLVDTPKDHSKENSGSESSLQKRQWKNMPIVITECTFLEDEHRENAERTKHTRWHELKYVVQHFPGTIFILVHFSLRYSKQEIKKFFEEEKKRWIENGYGEMDNVVVWI
ncbi:hypothetical protein G9A89_019956 [Geosiphon pyriformis]|nr:hypothetical protein G9A89_019956 [Geosiphon pyriformis]